MVSKPALSLAVVVRFEKKIQTLTASLYSTALDRISQIGGQISGNPTAGGRDRILEKRPDDVSHAQHYVFSSGQLGGTF